MGFFGRRKSTPRLNKLLPEEQRKVGSLYETSQTVTYEDDSEDTDTGLLIELYEEAARKEPHEFIYHYLLGTTYLYRGELEKAREILEKASSLKPDDPRPLYNLGAIYYGIWDARTEKQNGRTKEQRYRWVKETLDDPFLPDDLRQLGEDAVREFEYWMSQLDYETYVRTQDAYRKSSISGESAAANALYYFRKVLASKLHPEDRKAVEQHIRLIQALR